MMSIMSLYLSPSFTFSSTLLTAVTMMSIMSLYLSPSFTPLSSELEEEDDEPLRALRFFFSTFFFFSRGRRSLNDSPIAGASPTPGLAVLGGLGVSSPLPLSHLEAAGSKGSLLTGALFEASF